MSKTSTVQIGDKELFGHYKIVHKRQVYTFSGQKRQKHKQMKVFYTWYNPLTSNVLHIDQKDHIGEG